MVMNSDLQRSFLQYKQHIDLKYLKLNIGKRIMLAVSFFIFLPTTLIDRVWRHRKSEDVYVLRYNDLQPLGTIYKVMEKSKLLKFMQFRKVVIPVVPWVLTKDLTLLVIQNPLFLIKNFSFITALTMKIAHYYGLIYFNKITNLIVFQEYSFYMSYLTRVMEKRGGKLYNIMHGIPGKTYCHFRFSKCFVWSDYFKQKYIDLGADREQFVVSGSMFHFYIINNIPKEDPTIDIVYTMDGNVNGYKDVVWVLEKLATKYKVCIKQHPRQKIDLGSTLEEVEYDIIETISKSKIVVGHYTTALLDALVMNKQVVSYLGENQSKSEYIDFLDSKCIFYDSESLLTYMENLLDDSIDCLQKNNHLNIIDMSLEPLKVIEDTIYQN